MKADCRHRHSGRALFALAAAVVAAMVLFGHTSRVSAQDRMPVEPRPGDTVEWYTVQPGDTLSDLTSRFLGTARLWPENHRLNPQIQDPDRLQPGERIVLITNRPLEERSAEIVGLSPRVDKRLVTLGSWEEARLADRLARGDGLQTLKRASAELSFDDGTTLVVSQDSVIFLREIDRRLTGVSQETIEIEEGGADLIANPQRAGDSEIQVIIGGATARPKTGSSGRLVSRIQLAGGENGGGDSAELAVYEGSSSIAAAGSSIEVASGMGTTVPEDGPPNPPERLLPAPRPSSPAKGSRFGFSNPPFSWTEVSGAASYLIEICRDAECGSLVQVVEDLSSPAWTPESLPVGKLYWRVRGIAPSGLDGFPTRGVSFSIEGGPDRSNPVVALVVDPPGRSESGVVYLAPGGGLRPVLQDDQSGVSEVRYRWNGGAWIGWTGMDLDPPRTQSLSTLEVLARDRAGHESEPLLVEVHLVTEAPLPPSIRAGERR